MVIKLLAKSMSYMLVKAKLGDLWRLKGVYEAINVGNGYFMIKFDLPEEREKVITGGP